MAYVICWAYTRTGSCDEHGSHHDGPIFSYYEQKEEADEVIQARISNDHS